MKKSRKSGIFSKKDFSWSVRILVDKDNNRVFQIIGYYQLKDLYDRGINLESLRVYCIEEPKALLYTGSVDVINDSRVVEIQDEEDAFTLKNSGGTAMAIREDHPVGQPGSALILLEVYLEEVSIISLARKPRDINA